jgi:hypothetical protein
VHECAPEDFDPMMLARPPFGGGQFRVHVRSRTGIVANRLLKVLGAPIAPAQAPQITQADLISAMKEMQRENREAMQSMVLQLRPSETSPINTLDGIAKIAEMFRPQQTAQGGGIVEAFSLMEKAISLRDKLTPPAIQADGTVDPVAGGLALFREVRTMIAENKNAPAAAVAPAIAAPIEPESEEAMYDMLIKVKLKKGNALAAAGADYMEFADSIYELMPDDSIVKLATDNEWFAALCAINPETAKHTDWYAKVRAAIVEFASEDGLLQTATETATVAGNEATKPATESDTPK